MAAAHADEAWISEGNFAAATLAIRFPHVDLDAAVVGTRSAVVLAHA
jgi:hypothetical protein